MNYSLSLYLVGINLKVYGYQTHVRVCEKSFTNLLREFY